MNKNLMDSLFIEDYLSKVNYTYISQIGILTIKSLIPSMDDLGVRINYKRFTEELNMWKGYRVGDNSSLLNLDKIEDNIYWNGEDDSIISRILPIVISNQKFQIIEEEVIKNILFTSGNLGEVLEYICISHLLYLHLRKEGNIVEKLKSMIIEFAQVDFYKKYEKYYKIGLNNYPGNHKIEFEKEKIHIINLLNGIDNNKYEYLSDTIKVLDGDQGRTFVGKILYNYINEEDTIHNLPKFYLDMGRYLINLRKSRIDPKDLEIQEYILPDIFSFNEGDTFFHSLLRESKVIKKEVRNKIPTSLVQTRTGIYVFRKTDL